MSVLERDWRQLREEATDDDAEEQGLRAEATAAAEKSELDDDAPVERDAVGARTTGGRSFIRRTVRRFT